MRLVKASCYNCSNRKIGCHTTCEIYLEYKQRLAKIKENKEAYQKGFSFSKLKYCKTV